MKFIIAILSLVISLLPPNSCHAQDINGLQIDIDLNNATFQKALEVIEKQSPFTFSYKPADIADIPLYNYHRRAASVKKILDDLIFNTGLQYEVVQQHIVFKKRKITEQLLTVHGFVIAANTGEALIGASVILSGNRTFATITNAYGFYSVTVSPGAYTLSCSHVGLSEFGERLSIEKTLRFNIRLTNTVVDTMQAVTIVADKKKNMVRQLVTGYHQLKISDIKKMTMAGSEPDVLKSLQFLPGIQASAEGTANFSVRGGSFDQNLIMLDEAPVYNPTHTLGFFSAFNTDALKDVSVYKGVFPAQYGGRLSSVVDLRMKEGNNKQHEIAGSIGLLASRLTWEGPIKKERSSFLVSGRFSEAGSLLNLGHALGIVDAYTSKNKISFYDFNFKINTFLGKRDRLYLSAFSGRDNFQVAAIDFANRLNWGNTTVTARWNHVFNARLFANTSLLYSNYNNSNYRLDASQFSWKANLKEITLKTDFDWTTGKNNLLKTGAGITLQDVLPGKVIPNTVNNQYKSISLDSRRSAQLFAYVHHDMQVSKTISLSYGARATVFAALGGRMIYEYNADTTELTDSLNYPKGKIIRSYFGLEPKATARLMLNTATSLKLGYGRNYQFQHLLSNSTIGLPTDLWMPSDNWFKPQYSDHFSAGIYRDLAGEMFEISWEVYYQRSRNVIDFRDNAEIFLNDKVETQVLPGQARGYGIELLLKKNRGNSTGWISYTLAKAVRKVPGVNNDEWYSAAYDRRHNLSIVYNRTISKRLSISGNWVFRSGGRTTLPLGSFVYNGYSFLHYSDRNGYTLPAHHRLDLGLTWQQKQRKRRKWQGEWVFSVYNAYGRKNVYALYLSQHPQNLSYIKTTQVYLGGVLPAIAYNFKF
jgi:hypothetical protein